MEVDEDESPIFSIKGLGNTTFSDHQSVPQPKDVEIKTPKITEDQQSSKPAENKGFKGLIISDSYVPQVPKNNHYLPKVNDQL